MLRKTENGKQKRNFTSFERILKFQMRKNVKFKFGEFLLPKL